MVPRLQSGKGGGTQGFAVGPYGLPRALTLVGQPRAASLRPPPLFLSPVSHMHSALDVFAEVCTLRMTPNSAS